jgi:hypothetical protein
VTEAGKDVCRAALDITMATAVLDNKRQVQEGKPVSSNKVQSFPDHSVQMRRADRPPETRVSLQEACTFVRYVVAELLNATERKQQRICRSFRFMAGRLTSMY